MRASRPKRPKASRYITPPGYERFRRELEQLWHHERPKVVKGVAEAAAEGDRSENAEYIYGKRKLREIDRRIQFLSKRLDELEVVDPTTRRGDQARVYFGAWVRCEDEDGATHVWRIVGPDEHDMHPCHVSMDSPIGRALLGRRLDDEVLVRRPRGDLDVTVVEVSYSRFVDVPDAAPIARRGELARLRDEDEGDDEGDAGDGEEDAGDGEEDASDREEDEDAREGDEDAGDGEEDASEEDAADGEDAGGERRDAPRGGLGR